MFNVTLKGININKHCAMFSNTKKNFYSRYFQKYDFIILIGLPGVFGLASCNCFLSHDLYASQEVIMTIAQFGKKCNIFLPHI